MSKSYKRSKTNNELAQQRLRNKEFLAARKRQIENEEAKERINMRDYLKAKGELE